MHCPKTGKRGRVEGVAKAYERSGRTRSEFPQGLGRALLKLYGVGCGRCQESAACDRKKARTVEPQFRGSPCRPGLDCVRRLRACQGRQRVPTRCPTGSEQTAAPSTVWPLLDEVRATPGSTERVCRVRDS